MAGSGSGANTKCGIGMNITSQPPYTVQVCVPGAYVCACSLSVSEKAMCVSCRKSHSQARGCKV